jgi:hypothetical protein
MTRQLEPTDSFLITHKEYEELQLDSRKLRAIRDILDEYHISKKLVVQRISEENSLHRLRRRTLSRIQVLIQRKDI